MRPIFIASLAATIAISAVIAAAAPAAAQDAPATDKRDWSITATGGSTIFAGTGDQPFASVGVTRNFGDSYVRLTGTYVDGGSDDGAPLSTIPASTRQLTLGAGTYVGALGVDGYVSLGDRRFDRRAFTTRTGQTIALDSNGASFGAGLSLTYEIPLGDSAVLAPFVAGDYSRISIARALALPGGTSMGEESREDGITGSLGASALWLFGPDQRHSVGLYAAALTSSNNSAYNGTNATRATALGIGDQPGVSDEWIEYGATAAFGLSAAVDLQLAVVRTAGFLGPEATSVTAGVGFSF